MELPAKLLKTSELTSWIAKFEQYDKPFREFASILEPGKDFDKFLLHFNLKAPITTTYKLVDTILGIKQIKKYIIEPDNELIINSSTEYLYNETATKEYASYLEAVYTYALMRLNNTMDIPLHEYNRP